MSDLKQNINDDQLKEIEDFVQQRFWDLSDLRRPIDDEIKIEIDMYNNVDTKLREEKDEWEEKIEVPIIYSVVQTMVARLIDTLFPQANYAKVYVESDEFNDVQNDVTKWVQEELDTARLSDKSRDYLEEACTARTSWIQLRPVPIKKKKYRAEGNIEDVPGYYIDLDVHKWYDVWFDTKAREVMQTDFIVRKTKKLWELYDSIDGSGKPVYFNLHMIHATQNPLNYDADYDRQKARDAYKAMHSSSGSDRYSGGNTDGPDYFIPEQRFKSTDTVELLEYYGAYDFSPLPMTDPEYRPEMKEVIFTIANRQALIRIEEVELETKRKRLIFPIRPLRQANSLIGKSVSQLIKDLQHQSNEYQSLTMQNAKNLVKLMFKVNREANVDFDDLFAGAGNSVPYDGDPKFIDTFDQPNLVGTLRALAVDMQNQAQSQVGAVDPITGASTSGGGTDTASGIRTITEQALFKFSMMAYNCALDIRECITYMIILLIKFNRPAIELRYPKLADFFDLLPEELEDGRIIDIGLKNLSQRRDVEQNQWINFLSVIGPFLQQAGGNMPMLLKHIMQAFEMRDIDKLLDPEKPDQILAKLQGNPQLMQQVMSILTQQAGEQGQSTPGGRGSDQNPAQPVGGDAVERAANENIRGEG